MASLELKVDVKKEYAKATAAGKKLLEKLYGADTFKPTIIEQVNGIEDIYRLAGVNPKDYVVRKNMPNRQKKRILGEILNLIEEVMNEGKAPDMTNTNVPKYYLVFVLLKDKSGFGFSGTNTYYDFTLAHVGSRFCKKEVAEYAGKKFVKYYSDYLMCQY